MHRLLHLTLTLLCLGTAALAADPVKVVLIGDSTVAPKSGWGDAFIQLLKPGVEGTNLALGGRSTKSYFHEKAWQQALALKPTFLLIQFGHNDQPGKGPQRETDPKTTYPENLVKYIDAARAVGAQPILITSVVRRNFNADGKTLKPDLEPYAEAVRKVGAEQKVPVIDLHARSKEQIEKLGPEGCKPMQADAKGQPAGSGGDHTHFNAKGGEMTAPLVADELRRIKSDLAQYLK